MGDGGRRSPPHPLPRQNHPGVPPELKLYTIPELKPCSIPELKLYCIPFVPTRRIGGYIYIYIYI